MSGLCVGVVLGMRGLSEGFGTRKLARVCRLCECQQGTSRGLGACQYWCLKAAARLGGTLQPPYSWCSTTYHSATTFLPPSSSPPNTQQPPTTTNRFLKRDHIVRPHIEELLRLHPHFRIGVFSSATVRTVNTALNTLYAALQRTQAQRGIGGFAAFVCVTEKGLEEVVCALACR